MLSRQQHQQVYPIACNCAEPQSTMSSGATESTEEFGFVTRTPDQQLVEALGSPVEVGSCVHISDQQTLEDEDTTQDLDAINSSARVYTEHAVQAQELPRGVTSSLPVPDGQASEGQESTQEFTVPPHGLELDDALQGSITSASTDIPDRQAVRVDETTQALTASTIIYVPEDEATTSIGEATTQERTASTVIQIPDRQALGYDETTQEFTALRHVLDRQATEEGETTQEHTASTVQRVSDRGAIGDEETTQGLTAFKRNVDVPGASLESSASSPTHSSVRNVSGIQETAQEVSITTSFAARLPDRQVVEADALTPPPPLTITTQPSTALTHVTDTQAVDAHRGDSQPRLATPASHAALGQEVAAASSPPEAQTNPQGIETVQKDDERKATPSDLGEEITRLSMTVPSARLTIAYNRGFISDDEDLSKDVIRHLRTAGGWDLISVIQDADRADFILNLSYYTRPVEEAAGRFIPFSLSLQLIFQPASDNCVLFNHGGGTFYLEHLDAASTRTRGSIESMQCRVLRPGIWRISMRGEKPRENVFHSLVQWLILPRKFGASIDGESTKRQKLSETSLVRKHQETMILIKNLEDGQSARIWGVPGDTADYELQRIKHIASTSSARVFACRHSKVAGILAVKVIDYDAEAVNRFDRRSAAHLAALVAAFKRETSILQRLDNVSRLLHLRRLVTDASLTADRTTLCPSRPLTGVFWPCS